MFESRDQRFEVEKWVNAQPTCPTRKQTVKRFPDVPQRVIRAVLQSREDRDRAQPAQKAG